MARSKTCIKCHELKPLADFAPTREPGSVRHGRTCLACAGTADRSTYAAWVKSVLDDRRLSDGDDLRRPVKDPWGHWHYPARGEPVIERNVG